MWNKARITVKGLLSSASTMPTADGSAIFMLAFHTVVTNDIIAETERNLERRECTGWLLR